MGKKKSKEKQKKRKGPIQRAAPAQAQDNQSESSSTSRSRSPQLGQSVSNYEEQQPGTSEANDAAPFNNTMNLGFVVTLLNDIKPPALVLIDRDGAGVIKPQSQHHRLTLHDLRVHLQAALDDYEDFVRRGARVGEIAADETDVEDEAAAGPSGCNAPSDDVDLDEPGPSNRKMAEYHDWPPPSQIKMGKKKSKEKQKKRKGPIQRAAPAQAQDNQSESSSTSRSRSPQLGQSVSNYEEQQPGTSEANDAAPFNNTMNLGFVVTLLNDIKPPALVLIDRDGAGVIKPQSQHHRLTLHDLRVHLQAALDDYEDFVRRGARVGEIAADETDVEDEAAAGPSGCNAPSDDVDLDEPGPSNRKMAEYHDWPPPSQIKMGKKKSKEKQKKRKGPIQRAAPAQAQDNQSESSSTSRSRSPQLGQSVSNYEEQQPGTSEANDAAPFNNTMNLGFVVTLLNDIKPPALVLIDRDGAGVIKPQSQHHRLTLHDLRVHLQAALDDYEDFVRRGARVGEIAADETDVEDEAAAGPSGCNAPSDDVDLDEPGPSNRKMAEYHDWPPPSQIKMGKKKSKEKQKKRKGPIQRAAPAQAQDNQSESSSTSRSRSPQLGQSVSNYEEQQPGTSEANDAAPFNNTMNLGFVVTLLNDIKPPALVLIDRDGAGVIKPQSQHHRLTLHDLRVHLQAALDDYEDFVRRGARVGEIAADETDVEDEAAADPSGCNAPSDDVDLDEPGPSNRKMAEYHDWPPPSQIKMGKKKSKEKQKKRKGPIQRAAPAQAQDNQSESSSTSRSRSPQLGQSVSNYEEQQPGTSEANDAAPFNNTMNLGFVVTLLNDIKPSALVLIDRDGAGVIKPQSQHHRLTLHDLRVHLQAALDDYEDFVRRGARVGEIAADETDVEDEAAAGPSGCNAPPSDDVDLDEPGPSNRKMAEYHDCPFDRLHSSVHPHNQNNARSILLDQSFLQN
ncbi:unnamed protein product [Caenorhabditis brenneri]